MLRWIVELGRTDTYWVSLLLQSLALPPQGHCVQISHIFGYRRKHFNADMVFDPVGWVVPATDFQKKDWTCSIYDCDGFCDKLPVDIPKPLGKQSADESDHRGYRVTRRFPIGFELHDSAINSVLETPNIL